MADSKISALPAATTPLAGTEVLPIVQSGTTKKVSAADFTAGTASAVAASGITGTTLASGVVTSSLTTVSVLNAGSITSGFGSIDVGADAISGGAISGTTVAASSTISTSNGSLNITRNGGSAATITQQSAAGYGLTVIPGNDTLDAFTINNAANTLNMIRMYGSGDASFAGNLVIGTSGKGIDFSAASHAAGMTSELLADYEEGTWTPADSSGAGLSLTIVGTSTYTKIGRQVIANCDITYPATADASLTLVGGLPFTTAATPNGAGSIGYTDFGVWITVQMQGSGTGFRFVGAGGFLTNALLSGKRVQVCATFTV